MPPPPNIKEDEAKKIPPLKKIKPHLNHSRRFFLHYSPPLNDF